MDNKIFFEDGPKEKYLLIAKNTTIEEMESFVNILSKIIINVKLFEKDNFKIEWTQGTEWIVLEIKLGHYSERLFKEEIFVRFLCIDKEETENGEYYIFRCNPKDTDNEYLEQRDILFNFLRNI